MPYLIVGPAEGLSWNIFDFILKIFNILYTLANELYLSITTPFGYYVLNSFWWQKITSFPLMKVAVAPMEFLLNNVFTVPLIDMAPFFILFGLSISILKHIVPF